MSALDSLKVALNNENKALDILETYARNNEESYDQTINRLTLEGYIDGLKYALSLLEQATQPCRKCGRVDSDLFHNLCTNCYYGIKGAN